MTPTPFTLSIPDQAIADLKTRLALTRFPDQAPDAPWAYGTDLGYLKTLVAYWEKEFDWRAQERALNAFPQFKVKLPDIDLHYLHVPGKGPSPMPLLLLHGWPGSVFEFLDILPRLTDPASFGGDPKDAFTVVAPSLPGYGLSFTPGQRRFDIIDMAARFDTLMTDVLGYPRYGSQGGDVGAFATARLGYAHAKNLIGIHVDLLGVPRERSRTPTPEEQKYFQELAVWQKDETGYQAIQGTKPQTLAYGLTDSPAGLAAWIIEKFRTWGDTNGDVESAYARDRLLANIALYWFTASIGASFWIYYARIHGQPPVPPGATVDVPMGYCEFPKQLMRPPRSVAEQVFKDIRRWTVMPRGGHFAAMEQPDLLAEEIRAFFRELR